MSDELTLFGKAMVRHPLGERFELKHGAVEIRIGTTWVGDWFAVVVIAGEHVEHNSGFATKELARDDAEATLRELYEALGEVVEPWVFDRDPPPPANSMCDDGYLCTWDSEYATVVGEGQWDGEDWHNNRVVLNKPVAWRPMPKAPRRQP